jgi:hypothetical protein
MTDDQVALNAAVQDIAEEMGRQSDRGNLIWSRPTGRRD